jgi:hypothetical protein
MNRQSDGMKPIKIWVDEFDEEDWSNLLSKMPFGYSWQEEAYLAGEDYIEVGKDFLRSN